MAKQKELSLEENFFSRLAKSAGKKILKKFISPRVKRKNIHAGRIMVPLAEKLEEEIVSSRIFPTFHIKEDDAWKMFYFADSRPSEVSSLMRVEWSSDKIVFSHQIFPRQFCSTIKSDIDPEWLADYSRNIPSPEERAVFNCNLWMHSHISKNTVQWSDYDNDSISKMIKGKKFLISVVVSPNDGSLHYRCRIDLGEPLNLTVDDISIFIIKCPSIDHQAIRREMDQEYGEKVIVTEENSLFLCNGDDGFILGGDPGLSEDKND